MDVAIATANGGNAVDVFLNRCTPTNLVATATSVSQVGVTWNAMPTAVSYRVYRSTDNVTFTALGTTSNTSFSDAGLTPNTAYLYRVAGIDGLDAESAPGPIDLATTIVFSEDPIVPGVTVVKAAHIIELHAAVDAARAAAGLGVLYFPYAVAPGLVVQLGPITQLQNGLNEALRKLGIRSFRSSEFVQYPFIIRGADIQSTRTLVK
jgi:hypothetical protein